MKRIMVWMAALAVSLSVGVLAAQAENTPIKQRQINQQHRIAQGVKSGSLTAGETRHLERQEARLNREVKTMRRENGGTLTPAERRRVTRQQNHLSREIYRDKHNTRTR